MSLLKKLALSCVLLASLCGCAVYSVEEVDGKIQRKKEYTGDIWKEEFRKEMWRKRESLDYEREFIILRRESYRYAHPHLNLERIPIDPDDEEDIRNLYLRTAAGASNETIDRVPWANAIEDRIKRLTNYELEIRGSKAGEYSDDEEKPFELREEERKERAEEGEKTKKQFVTDEFGRRYIFRTGVGTCYSENTIIGGEAYAKLKDFKIMKSRFEEARLSANTDNEAIISLTKRLSPRWHTTISNTTYLENWENNESRLSFIRESGKRRLKFMLGGGYGKEKKAFVEGGLVFILW